MSIKEITREDFCNKRPCNKRRLFIEDVKQIIENRIEYCELVDFPYSKKTALNDVIRYAQIYLAKLFFEETGIKVKNISDMPFCMTKYRDNNNELHIYCAFYVKSWDTMIVKAKEHN